MSASSVSLLDKVYAPLFYLYVVWTCSQATCNYSCTQPAGQSDGMCCHLSSDPLGVSRFKQTQCTYRYLVELLSLSRRMNVFKLRRKVPQLHVIIYTMESIHSHQPIVFLLLLLIHLKWISKVSGFTISRCQQWVDYPVLQPNHYAM